MAKPAEPEINHLLPLEYCSPERAARLLGCEVEDIFHWASVGAINLYAQIYEFESDAPLSMGVQFDEVIIGKDVPLQKKPVEGAHIETEMILYSHGELLHDAKLLFFETDEGTKYEEIYLGGFWAVDRLDICSIHVHAKPQAENGWVLTATYIGEQGTTRQPSGTNNEICLVGVKMDDLPERLKVMREDLLKIRDHMISGEVMSKTPGQPRPKKMSTPSTMDNPPHHSAERNAASRERVLAAAIRARELWPEECQNATAWAATLEIHSHELFKSDKTPIAQEGMARILSKALNEGAPYKKS